MTDRQTPTFVIQMTLNIIWSYDVEKRTRTKPSIEFVFFKIFIFVFVQKSGSNNLECYMYKVTK